MVELVQENWILFLIALVIGIGIAWWIFVATRRTHVETTRHDTLDEGAERTKRNQALIDAPPAAAAGLSEIPPATPTGMAGTGAAVASAAEPVEQTGQAPEPELPATPPVPEQQPPATPPVSPVQPAPEPVMEPEPIQETEAPGAAPAADDLKRIKGIGPKLETTLHSLGVTSFAQIAEWDDAEIERIDAQLGRFQGRIQRDHWAEQARFLVSGDQKGYEDRFGRI